MTLEEEVMALLAQAEPLRCLPDDEPAKAPLTGLVDQINALRAVQAGESKRRAVVPERDPEAPLPDPITEQNMPLPARRPGRPRKVSA